MTISKRVREAVYMASEGRSDSSGALLGDDWHVDHMIPKAAGGLDDISNLQALTARENSAKSCACPPPLRAWQERCLEKWARTTSDNFLLVALPGAGKTLVALTVAQQWIRENPDRRRVLIVVPYDPLKKQWQNEASSLYGLQFQTKEFTGFKSSMHGGIITYQLVASSPFLFKQLCSRWDVLLISDEIHHAGDRNEWGSALREATCLAKRRLLLSGTPFRSDGSPIPFVTYDGTGVCVADDRYDYPDAIRDEVIRVVRFQHDKGLVRRLTAAGEVSDELHSGLAETEADDILGDLIEPGTYTLELLRRAVDKLNECRRRMSDAAGLVLCKDQRHAEAIAKQLTNLTGLQPDIIVSDDEIANSSVQDFRDSNRPWVVAVRQVSEGVDIKRLLVLVYLTTTRTQLFFRQAVGRIVRNMGTEYDMEAYCFIPDHPKLVRHAQNIVEAQDQAITAETDEQFRERVDRILQPSLLMPIVVGTEHTGSAGAIIEGECLKSDEAIVIEAMSRDIGISETHALKAKRWLESKGSVNVVRPIPSSGLRSPVRPLEQQIDSARTALAAATKRAAFRLKGDHDPDFAAINTVVNQHIGKFSRGAFTLDELHRAIKFVSQLGIGAA